MVQFTKLKLSGFKSFPYPGEIEIGPGKTGVVGPNGCGKSNLLEALGWVMGETSAKRLRGDGMEDVIFNGTDRKAARTSAEVTLCLKNNDGSAPPPYRDCEDIEVTRRITRGMGSDYSINGKSVRAKDVQLLFADLVSGANSPALVSQGRITAIIQAKPKDRRRILEDAAGISGLHARRHEAELKLRSTTANLERLDDIIGQSDNQLASLKKQARQAVKYRKISDEIQSLEALILAKSWQLAKAKSEASKKAFDSVEGEIREAMQIVSQLASKKADKAATIPELREKEAEKAAIVQRLSIEREQIRRDLERQKNEKRDLENNAKQALDDLNAETERLQSLEDRLSSLSEEKKQLFNENENSGQNRGDLENEIAQLKTQLEQEREHFDQKKQTLMALENEINALQNQKIALESQIANDTEEEKKYRERVETLQSRKNQQTLFDSLKDEIEQKEGKIASSKTKRDSLEDERQGLDIEIGNQQKVINHKQGELNRLEAEIDALQQLLSGDKADQKDYEAIINKIDVDSGYEKALAAAMGEGLDYPLMNEALIYWSKLGAMDLAHALPEGVTPMLDKVNAPDVLARALSQIGVVGSFEQGEALSKQLQAGQSLVSEAGDLWRWDGLVASADAPSPAAVKLKQKNRLSALEKECVEASHAVEKEQTKIEGLESKKTRLDETLSELRETLRGLDQDVQEQRTKLGSMEREYHEIERDLASANTALERILSNKEDSETKLKGIRSDLASKADIAPHKQDIQSLQDKVEGLQTSLREKESQLSHLTRDQDRKDMRLQQIDSMISEAEQNSEQIKTRLETLKERANQAQTKLEALDLSPEAFDEKTEKLGTALHEAQENRRQAQDVLHEAESDLKELEAQWYAAETALNNKRENRASLKADYQNAVEKMESIVQTIAQDFELSPVALIENFELQEALSSNETIESHNQRLQKLKLDRERIGPVNLRAEIEAEELEKEIEQLRYEESELITAIHKLRGAIGKLNKEARERLLEAFSTVDGYFRKLFAELFGGGKAYLQLTDSDDPLEAGLDIYAQPPGKKLQNLSLLSGGEQTLTSIALVFGMFLTNPSPICVLDEIDAALDDANVDRVCNLLDKIAEKGETRFLVISHHRMTVARMDRLYGVTMAERGISQLVSVDLSQGELWMPDEENQAA